jgi:spore coat polysaccharide biosynthesis predicted glycosyltransferase SpsG
MNEELYNEQYECLCQQVKEQYPNKTAQIDEERLRKFVDMIALFNLLLQNGIRGVMESSSVDLELGVGYLVVKMRGFYLPKKEVTERFFGALKGAAAVAIDADKEGMLHIGLTFPQILEIT